jgi:hypothetical protein
MRRWICTRLSVIAVAGIVVLCGAAGCSSNQPQTTQTTLDDIDHVTARITEQLAGSDFLAERTSGSEPIVITCRKAENLTINQIKESELWMFVLKVQSAVNSTPLARSKRLEFQIPPEKLAMLRSRYPEATSGVAAPTHVMTATIRSAPRFANDKGGFANARTDLYFFEYAIARASDGKQEWNGTVEFKRQALGSGVD